MNFFILIFICTLVLEATQEQIFYKYSENQALRIELRETKPNSRYVMDLIDYSTGKTIARVDQWHVGLLPSIKYAMVDNYEKNKLYIAKIFRDQEVIKFNFNQPEKIPSQQIEIRRDLGLVKWSQSYTALTRVYASKPTGMYLGCLQEWSLTGAGNHSVFWDFKDHQGLQYVARDRDVYSFLQVYKLPQNFIVTGSLPYEKDLLTKVGIGDFEIPNSSIEFSYEVLNAQETLVNKLRVYNLSDNSAIRFKLGKKSKRLLSTRRFEIIFFLNGQFFHEEAHGVDPYTYALPRLPKSKGLNFLTVNYIDYFGNISSQIIPITFN